MREEEERGERCLGAVMCNCVILLSLTCTRGSRYVKHFIAV